MSSIPTQVDDSESLHRRVHPTFKKPDGSVSSQAFTDPDLSVDRASYRSNEETLAGYAGYGLVAIVAADARAEKLMVLAEPELLNPAHAVVRGTKTRSVARKLARSATWVVGL